MADHKKTDRIVIGGGCFWCIEAVFKRIPGVLASVPGYSGGATVAPSYDQVCSGATGHAEVVELTYDPELVGLDAILDIFFSAHDPTTKNRQGADVGTQYRSVVFYSTDEQRDAALRKIRGIDASGLYPNPVATQVEALKAFYPAEECHRDYYDQHPFAGYCRVVIAPKLTSLGLPQQALRT